MQNSKFYGTGFLLLATAILLSALPSCKKSDLQETSATEPGASIESLRQAVANSTGLPLEKVQYLKNENEFLIDNDGIVTLEDAKARFSRNVTFTPFAANGATQMESYYMVAPTKVKTISIYVDGTVPDEWENAIDKAIQNWNETGTSVHMERVSSSYYASTRISTTFSYSSVIASSAYPDYYGNPGRKVVINTYFNSLQDAQKEFALTHELGHTLGFTHTNGTFGNLINGTPVDDPNSIMNAVCSYWNSFTDYDLAAFRIVYP